MTMRAEQVTGTGRHRVTTGIAAGLLLAMMPGAYPAPLLAQEQVPQGTVTAPADIPAPEATQVAPVAADAAPPVAAETQAPSASDTTVSDTAEASPPPAVSQAAPAAAEPAEGAADTPALATPPAAQDIQPEAEAESSGTAVTRITDGIVSLLPEDVVSQFTAPRRDDLPHDLSPWGMFMAADNVVKAVMIGLVFASIATWTIWIAKTLQIAAARRRARSTYRHILRGDSLGSVEAALGGRGGPAAAMVAEAVDELRRSDAAIDLIGGAGLRERVSLMLGRIEVQAGRRLSQGTGMLATIGSTAPFVGLFGTVWGIMNSFISISESQTTNLAIVAPGIAEALLATGLGLVAAIPAVVIYNVFARSITGYRQILGDTAAAVERLLSRDLDFRAAALVETRPGTAAPVAAE